MDITLSVPGNLKARDLTVDIKKNSISAGVKGQEAIIKVYTYCFYHHYFFLPHLTLSQPNSTHLPTYLCRTYYYCILHATKKNKENKKKRT